MQQQVVWGFFKNFLMASGDVFILCGAAHTEPQRCARTSCGVKQLLLLFFMQRIAMNVGESLSALVFNDVCSKPLHAQLKTKTCGSELQEVVMTSSQSFRRS